MLQLKVRGVTIRNINIKHTQDITEYLRNLSYTVIEMWECNFNAIKQAVSSESKRKYFYPTE